jgi:tRNA (mo5U34)-methyltransferase
MNKEEIQARASKLLWFHNYELLPGVMTNGSKPIKEEELAVLFQIPQDLRGKRVLDIGCADGYYTFLAEERGASVVAIDALPSQGFFLAHEVRGSKAEFHQMDLYDLQPDTLGVFDIVFFMGVYYHLKNPILALERIASITREQVIIESHIMNPTNSNKEGLSRFYEHDELAPGDPTNWWAPNVPCLLQTVRAAGFPRAELVTCYNKTRAVIHAYKGSRTAMKVLTEDFVCAIYTPLANAEVSGTVQISGVAFSKLEPEGGIDRIGVYLDKLDDPNFELGEAKHGIWLASIAARNGDKYGPAGFEFTWNTADIAPGQHTLYVLVEGKRGWHYFCRPIVVEDSSPRNFLPKFLKRNGVI